MTTFFKSPSLQNILEALKEKYNSIAAAKEDSK